MVSSVPAVALPKDAALVELRADALTFETRECILPGTPVAFTLVLEGHPVKFLAPTEVCLVIARDRNGYLYQSRIPLADIPAPDRTIVALFIAKGRGAPVLVSPAASS